MQRNVRNGNRTQLMFGYNINDVEKTGNIPSRKILDSDSFSCAILKILLKANGKYVLWVLQQTK